MIQILIHAVFTKRICIEAFEQQNHKLFKGKGLSQPMLCKQKLTSCSLKVFDVRTKVCINISAV